MKNKIIGTVFICFLFLVANGQGSYGEPQSSFLQIGNIAIGAILGSIITFIITQVLIKGKIENSLEALKNEMQRGFDEKKKELDTVFQNSINQRKEKIEGWIKNHDKEDDLISKSTILLVGQEDMSNVRDILTKIGFSDKNIIEKNQMEKNKNYSFDILFINNETAEIKDSETLKGFLDLLPKETLVFYYNKTRTVHFPVDKLEPFLQKKVNFVNSPAQIFGNLLNTLKFRKRLIEYGGLN